MFSKEFVFNHRSILINTLVAAISIPGMTNITRVN